MAASLSTLDALLKNVYLPGITSWIYNQRPIWDRIQKDADKSRFSGREYIMAAKTANTEGVGARAEGAALPLPQNTSLVNMTLQMGYHYATIKLSRQIISAADSAIGGFADAIDVEVTAAREALELDMARAAVFGDASGFMGRVLSGGGASPATLVLYAQPTNVGMPGVKFIRSGQVLDTYTALSGGSNHALAWTASSVIGGTTNSFILTGTAGGGNPANDDYIFRNLARGVEMMGIAGIVDDGTLVSSFQGLTRSSNPGLQANVLANGGTLRAVSTDLMDQGAAASQTSQTPSGSAWPTAIYTRLEIQRRAANFIRADRRFDPKEMTLNNGYKAMEWTTPGGTIPWIYDYFVRDNQIFFVNEQDLIRAVQEEIQWDEMDGSMWIRDMVSNSGAGSHAYTATLFTFQQIGSRRCSSHTLCKDVSYTL